MKNDWKIIKHPLIKDNLTKLRNKETKKNVFVNSLKRISSLLVFNVSQKLTTKLTKISTPFVKIESPILNQEIIVIPILRAGLGMLESFLEILYKAKVGHIGLKRNEKDSNDIQKYYVNIPSINDKDCVIILDPMIATGNSAIKAINEVRKKNSTCNIIFVSIIVSKAAQKNIDQKIKNIVFFATQIDPTLNSKKYIIPGLGDAGNRFFGC